MGVRGYTRGGGGIVLLMNVEAISANREGASDAIDIHGGLIA